MNSTIFNINHKNNFNLNPYHKDFYSINQQAYVDYLLAYHCMPTLLKMKPSNLIHINRSYLEDLAEFIIILNRLEKF